MNHPVLIIFLLSLLLSSCATIAPGPRHEATEPGHMIGKKPETQEIAHRAVLEETGIVRPDASEILRQLEEQNREFNERVRDVISRHPRRVAELEDHFRETLLGEAQALSMNFFDADLVEVIRLFMTLLEADYILHPQVSGRVTLSIEDTFRPDQMLDLLEGILRINGMALVETDGVYEIMPLARVQVQVSRGRFHIPDDGLSPRRGQMIQGFRLHFISATDMTTIIKPHISEGAQVYAHDANGVMLVCDYPHNLVKVSQLIEIFDESVFAGIYTATYSLTRIQAEDAAQELEAVAKTFGLGDDKTGVHGRVSFLPLPRLNMLLALTRDPLVLEFVEVWLQELDREMPQFIQEQYGEGVYVYYVQYGNAAEIVSSLQGLFEYKEPDKEEDTMQRMLDEMARPGPDPGPEVLTEEFPPLIHDAPFPTPAREAVAAGGRLTGPVVFVVDEPNNAVLIRCNTVDYPKIMTVIEMIDQYPRQVLIEVLIAEVNLTEDTRLGMEWRMLDYKDGVTQDLRVDTGIGGLFGDTGSITSGLSYMVSNTNRLRAALRASAADGHTRILSTPTLLASDNKEAVINIGQEVPIATSRRVRHDDDDERRTTETTIQYRDTGIILKVTPKINRQGMVRMEISQEVSDYYLDPQLHDDSPVITTRHASTLVAVNDQQTIVIGGLMQQQHRDISRGVPGLHRVPLLKYLFGYQQKQFENSELIIFITPHVIIDEEDSAFITRDFLRRLERIKAGMR